MNEVREEIRKGQGLQKDGVKTEHNSLISAREEGKGKGSSPKCLQTRKTGEGGEQKEERMMRKREDKRENTSQG